MESFTHLLSAFGLGVASGLSASIPLAIVAVLARFHLITLAPPFDSLLGNDVAVWGLLTLAIAETLGDKVPRVDTVMHALLFPLAVGAGAILFAEQAGAVTSVDPGLSVLVGLLAGGATAGAVHTVRATLRPLTHLALIGHVISLAEDASAASLTGIALFAPSLVPVVLLVFAIGMFLLVRFAWRTARQLLGPRVRQSVALLLELWRSMRRRMGPGRSILESTLLPPTGVATHHNDLNGLLDNAPTPPSPSQPPTRHSGRESTAPTLSPLRSVSTNLPIDILDP